MFTAVKHMTICSLTRLYINNSDEIQQYEYMQVSSSCHGLWFSGMNSMGIWIILNPKYYSNIQQMTTIGKNSTSYKKP